MEDDENVKEKMVLKISETSKNPQNEAEENLGIDLEHLQLSEAAQQSLDRQNSRIVTEFKANKLEVDARKNWDLFYKRNETKFFKDRHWTTREFQELAGGSTERKTLLEVGCGVGNFVFPLLEEGLDMFIYCCDFSARGVDFVKQNPQYSEDRIKAFVCDITTDTLVEELGENSIDIISMVFVLSAIHPDKHDQVFKNLYRVLKPGGVLLFRDYALYDMTMIRFGPGSKISDRLYTRQDGTRTFFFTPEDMGKLGKENLLEVSENSVIQRRTVNKKEGVDAQRLFIQTKFVKSLKSSDR